VRPDDPAADAAFAAEARRLAGLAFDTVMSGVPPQREELPPELEPADAVRWVGDRVTELVAGFAELPLDRLLGLAVPTGATPAASATEDPAAVPRGEPLSVTAPVGGLGEVRIWIHPLGDLATGTLGFRLGDLHPGVGEPLAGGAAVFAPAEVTVSGAVTSILLRVPIPPGTRRGRYDGLVLAYGVVDAVLPITVVVT
jgi:hypothetical protein